MGVGHSMNQSQVESVLSNFEDTMKAIKGIEQKADRVNEMLSETQRQQDALHGQMDRGQEFVKSVTDSLNLSSSQVLHFRDSLEGIVEVVEKLEDTLYDLGLRDLPGKMQREFGPIFVPVLVLTLIVTVSNCAFGFLLATDAELSLQGGTMNMVNMFATIHVVLIGLAVLHLVVEIVLRVVKTARRRRAARSREEQLQAVGDDRAEHSAEEEESPQPRPRANSDPGVVTGTQSERSTDVHARAVTAEQTKAEAKMLSNPNRASPLQDCRKSHKSVASRDTEGSFTQGSPKRATSQEGQSAGQAARSSHASPEDPPRSPARPKAAISGMLRAALQTGSVSMTSYDGRSSLTPSESSGPQADRIVSAFHAIRKGMEKVSGRAKGDSLRGAVTPTQSDVVSEPSATPRAGTLNDNGMDADHGDGPSVSSI